ncbi:hypothetical protein WOLCODRAFT_165892 [Wolfiporia cocos MD-104 SS10]|uniref:Uncharacterized protein n=1 Tax=Wolfiporia cocos (strain MD-104) TaxID=742152 RepID=A0A2H3JFW7_WOLCO|nr:hypothetical protein WOLCODRAFT_165892 [Wolfiporia cocos MD-104 SS10]
MSNTTRNVDLYEVQGMTSVKALPDQVRDLPYLNSSSSERHRSGADMSCDVARDVRLHLRMVATRCSCTPPHEGPALRARARPGCRPHCTAPMSRAPLPMCPVADSPVAVADSLAAAGPPQGQGHVLHAASRPPSPHCTMRARSRAAPVPRPADVCTRAVGRYTDSDASDRDGPLALASESVRT